MKPPPEAYRFTTRLVPLEAGLHGIRYLSSGEEVEAPSIMIQALPVDADAVDHMPSPGSTPGCLTKPGEMLILRAHRNVHVVTTIVSTSALAKVDGLQLKVERLDRQPAKPKPASTGGRAVAVPPVAAAKPKPAMLEIVETGPNMTPAKARPVTPAVKKTEPVGVPASHVRVPMVAVGLLVAGARAWRMGTIDSLPEAQNEVVVGVRLAVREDRASSYQLRLVARLSDGRLREALGHDVRAEAMGDTSVFGIAAQFRGPDNAGWLPLCDVDFSQVS